MHDARHSSPEYSCHLPCLLDPRPPLSRGGVRDVVGLDDAIGVDPRLELRVAHQVWETWLHCYTSQGQGLNVGQGWAVAGARCGLLGQGGLMVGWMGDRR